MRATWAFLLLSSLAACANDDPVDPTFDSATTDGASDTDDAATDSAPVDTSVVDAPPPGPCLEAAGTPRTSGTLVDGTDTAQVAVTGAGCARTFTLSTTGPLRDGVPENPRVIVEDPAQPTLHANAPMLEALYALALAEAKQASVTSIKDGAFDDGKPAACDCFETGRLWTYVWTRDTSYAADLGLAVLDPARTQRSLSFKLSTLRSGGGTEVVQDTGSGGSWPVSTDRVVFALGAARTLAFLDGAARTAFRDATFEALDNTLKRDDAVVRDVDGLYRGEQSFLDWREQSYPPWTATDVAHIGMGKALSTNVLHLVALRTVAALADEKGLPAVRDARKAAAAALATAIAGKFALPDGRLSSFTTTALDPAPVRRTDALATALAVLHDAVDPAKQKAAIAATPLLPKGPPVIFPQQKDTAIYHNRAIWPFVTAYFARAARKVRNDLAVNVAYASLVRGAALNLSHMENFEAVSGKAWVDDGAYSGPVVDSQRQLWSVAAFASLVHDVLFGLETDDKGGTRFSPYVTRGLRHAALADADSLVLSGLALHGKRLNVVVKLPKKDGDTAGAYAFGGARLDGKAIGAAFFSAADLGATSTLEIDLVDTKEASSTVKLVSSTADYKNLFAPKPPSLGDPSAASGKIAFSIDPSGETPAEIAFTVYRDGVAIGKDLPGTTTSFTDPDSSATSPSHCYTVEATFVGSGNTSQHASPRCYWGASGVRVASVLAPALVASGGALASDHGRAHVSGWGDAGHTLTASFTAKASGAHLVQVTFANGAGSVNTGVTCAVKHVKVLDGATVVGSGYVLMPHTGGWDAWRDSSFVSVDLVAGKTYAVVLESDAMSANMSRFAHFARYTGGLGGSAGAFERVDVAEIKLLQR